MGQKKCVSSLIFWGLFVFSLGQEEPEPEYYAPVLFTPIANIIKFQDFDWELFKAINRINKNPNLIVSTFSVKLLLATLIEAGDKNIKDEISNKLFPQVALGLKIQDYYETNLPTLNEKNDKYQLYFGNKIYLNQTLTPKPQFLDVIRKIYEAEVQQVNFAESVGTASIINDWAYRKTNGNIRDLIKPEDLEAVVAVLVNTIYFKGTWESVFSEEFTEEDEFYVNSKKTVKVPMMSQTGTFYYDWDANNLGADGAKALRLGYRGGKYAMTIILPNNKDGLDDVINSIDESKIRQFQYKFTEFEMPTVAVRLPKFKFESTTNLNDILKSIGITSIFDSNSSLIGLGGEQFKVSKILQKTGITVNEVGSEIYAATYELLLNKRLPPNFLVVHPFMFFIEDEKTGIVLFAGKVTNPAA